MDRDRVMRELVERGVPKRTTYRWVGKLIEVTKQT